MQSPQSATSPRRLTLLGAIVPHLPKQYFKTVIVFNVIFRTLCPTAKQAGLRTMWHMQRQNICVAQKRPYGRGEEISLSQSKQGQRQRTVKLTAQQRLSFILAKLVQCSFACGRGLAFISLQRPKSFPAYVCLSYDYLVDENGQSCLFLMGFVRFQNECFLFGLLGI